MACYQFRCDCPAASPLRACVIVVVRQRPELMRSRLLGVYGLWQRDLESGGPVRHLIAGFLRDRTPMLGSLATQKRAFH